MANGDGGSTVVREARARLFAEIEEEGFGAGSVESIREMRKEHGAWIRGKPTRPGITPIVWFNWRGLVSTLRQEDAVIDQLFYSYDAKCEEVERLKKRIAELETESHGG